MQCYTFSFYKLQSRGVARAGVRVRICDHIACESCHLGGSGGMPNEEIFAHQELFIS